MKKILMLFLLLVSFEGFSQDSPGVYTINNAKINTTFSDFGTAFLGDNKVVFASPKEGFTLNREENNSQPFLDLYMGEVTEDGQLIRKQKMPGDINTKFHEGMVSFSKDMKTVYFSANGKIKKVKRKDKKNIKTKATITIQLFKATIDENGEWGNLEMLPFNSDDFSTGHPVLNRDDTKLYFVSDRPESLGKTDIFVVDILGDGTYSQPLNLGPKINTLEREMFPFIGKDNVLYFSSDGIPGYGELDVFASKIFDNTVSTPINLEAPVNSEKDDFAYIINDTKHKGYFSSNREGGKGDDDIYTFTASPPIYIECEQEISGIVKNIDTQELIPNVQIMLFDENGTKLQSFLSNEADASFSFMQSCNTNYKLKGYLEGYLIGELDIKTANDLHADPIEIVMNMSVDPTTVINPIAEADESEERMDQAEANSEVSEAAAVKESSKEDAQVVLAETEANANTTEKVVAGTVAAGVVAGEAKEDNNLQQESIAKTDVKETAYANDTQAEIAEADEINKKTVEDSKVALADTKSTSNTTTNASGKVAAGVVVTETLKDKDNDVQQESIAESELKKAADVKGTTYINNTQAEIAEADTNHTQAAIAEADGINEDAVKNSTVVLADAESESETETESKSTSNASGNVAAGVVAAETIENNDTQQEVMAGSKVKEAEVADAAQSEWTESEAVNKGPRVDSKVATAQATQENQEELAKTSDIQSSDLALNHGQDVTDADNFHINTIYFDFDKHDIRYDAQLEMDKLVKVLKSYPQMKIKISAHTDIRGTRKYNAGLSDKRADKTVEYLVKKGIESERITGLGFGEMQLAEKCTKANPCTGFQHQLNRRSEFLIMKNGTEDFIVKSRNRQNSLDNNDNAFISNSGLFTNYNFYENNEVYTVQIGAFHGDVQTAKYSKLTNLFHHKYEDGFSRYFAGIFETSSEARNYMRIMRKNGFNDAFVVGLKGQDRF